MGGSPAHAAVPREGPAHGPAAPLWPASGVWKRGGFVVFLASVRTAAALGQPAAHWIALAGFSGSVIKWPVGRPDRRASALHDGSRPGPWGGGLKGPACLCSSRPDRLGRARPFRGDACGGPPGPSQPVVGGDRDPLWRAGPSWAFLSSLGLVAAHQGEREREPAGPGKRPCGPLSANAAVFSGVSRLRRGPSRISLPVGRFPAGFSPGLFPHCFPESPAGLFFSPGRLPRKGPAGKGLHRGFLWPPRACPGPFSPLSAAGEMPPSRFSPRRPGRSMLPFWS